MDVKMQQYRLNQKINGIQDLINKGIATFNGFKSVEDAESKVDQLKKELAQIEPEIEKVDKERANKIIAQKLNRHKKAKTWSRQGINKYMREFGYKWQKSEIFDLDQMEEYHTEYAQFRWELVAPDGRIVKSVDSAMNQIENLIKKGA